MPDADEDAVVSFEDFKRLRMVVGRVIEVTDHPSADKLLLLKVDMGGGKEKQLVAGLKGCVPVDEIKGKLVAVVDNLKPAVLRGERSEGMILAALDGDKIALLVPHTEVSPGSTIA